MYAVVFIDPAINQRKGLLFKTKKNARSWLSACDRQGIKCEFWSFVARDIQSAAKEIEQVGARSQLVIRSTDGRRMHWGAIREFWL